MSPAGREKLAPANAVVLAKFRFGETTMTRRHLALGIVLGLLGTTAAGCAGRMQVEGATKAAVRAEQAARSADQAAGRCESLAAACAPPLVTQTRLCGACNKTLGAQACAVPGWPAVRCLGPDAVWGKCRIACPYTSPTPTRFSCSPAPPACRRTTQAHCSGCL